MIQDFEVYENFENMLEWYWKNTIILQLSSLNVLVLKSINFCEIDRQVPLDIVEW